MNILHTKRQAYSWINSMENIAFLVCPFSVCSAHMKKDTNLSHLVMFQSLKTKLSANICTEGGDISGHTTSNLKGSSIPTILELPCCSFRSCHTRLTDGRCSNIILHATVSAKQASSGAGMTQHAYRAILIYKNIVSVCV